MCEYVCEVKINIGHYRVLFLGHLGISADYERNINRYQLIDTRSFATSTSDTLIFMLIKYLSYRLIYRATELLGHASIAKFSYW